MPRLPVLSCLLLAAVAVGPGAPSPGAQDGLRACKPEAPIVVELEVDEDGSARRVAFRMQPLLELDDLRWSWELDPDVRLVDGALAGTGAPQRGALSAGAATLQVPNDGLHRTARLVVTGELHVATGPTGGAAEPVAVVRTVSWGRAGPATATVFSPQGDAGAPARVAVVPATHVPSGHAPAPPAPGGAAEGAAPLFTVSGRFQYEDKEWSYAGWTGDDPVRPIRRADVTVLDGASQAVLGRGFTAQDGSFAIPCSSAGAVDVIVRCDTDTRLDSRASASQPLRVTTEADVEYSVFSPVFGGHPAPAPLDIGSVVAGKLGSGGDEANPFNLLDLGVAALEYIAAPQVGAALLPTPTDTTLRFVWPSPFGSLAFELDAYIGGDDGYDDAVILHEFGHVLQAQYSSVLSPGGNHFFGNSDEDPRLAYSEGYATFFAGCVLDSLGREGLYVDCNGSAQTGGFQVRLRLETANPFQGDAFGAADEAAVACTLYDLIDDEQTADATPGVDDDPFVTTTVVNGANPHAAWWQAFVGPIEAAVFTTMNDAWDGWFEAHAADPHYAELRAIFGLRRLDFWPDAQEPDDDRTLAVPIAATAAGTWTLDRTRYTSLEVPPVPGTGDKDWYAVDLVAGSLVDIETRYPGGAPDADTQCDTFLFVHDPSGAVALTTGDGGVGRNAAALGLEITQSGTWHFVVAMDSSVRRYGRYDVRVRYVLENHAPFLVAGPTATPDEIDDDQTATLAVSASDPEAGQALTCDWTPLDGGEVVGEGASVLFDPPAVAAPALFRVRLVVRDELGAESAPVVVDVRVDPAAPSPCALPASVATGGGGKPGLLGTPVLAADGLPVVPSSDFALRASGCHPGLAATLVCGFTVLAAPFDGGTLVPSPDVLLPLGTDSHGELHLPIGLASDPALCGLTLHCQLLVLDDPGAAGAKQTAQSNALTLHFGQ